MPIEIKELHIKAVVEDQVSSNTATASPTAFSTSQVNAIIAECVEQVLSILKEKQER